MTVATISKPDDAAALQPVDLSRVKLDPRCSRAIPASAARRFQAVALCRIGDETIVATSNPRVELVRTFLSQKPGGPFRLVRSDEAGLRRLINQIYPPSTSPADMSREADGRETVDACDDLLSAALLRGASDIHLLPGEKGLLSRFRVDGVLEDYRDFPPHMQSGMISRFKVLAGMNIAEKRVPQDGRFTAQDTNNRRPVDVRAATIPTRYGERVTLRLLFPMVDGQTLADLGMGVQELDLFNRAVESPNGLVLLTGPTGCGKSTTLYIAIKQLLRSRGGNIITVEDPIEYEIPGVTQVEVDSTEKVSFSRALRSILRHDPDVIMLGEIRDAETAELAIKASLTGHLVFSTLHTNTAAGAVTRLIDMGVEPFLIAATLRLSIAQRLVRRLCPHCRTPVTLDATDAAALGRPTLAGEEAFAAAGCVYCAGKGFAGRTALFEMLAGDSRTSELIAGRAGEAELLEHARGCGRPLLIDDGVHKILSGTTTARQVAGAVAVWQPDA